MHDPSTGELLGALDVTGGDHVASPYMLTLVRAAAAAAEAELRWQQQRGTADSRNVTPISGRVVTESAARTATLEVLGRDRGHLVLPERQVELSLRHSELLLLLCEAALAGQGRTAGQLMLETRGRAPEVTIRAEMSRLRRVVGQDLLASRPYRLLRPIDSDLARVRRLLVRGASQQALDSYRGPLLPTSDAPQIVELRDELAARLQATQGPFRG